MDSAHRPLRLNVNAYPYGHKRKSMSIAQGRGTMSMPTSPLRTGGNEESCPWNEGPQTAQAFFGGSAFPPFLSPQEGWFPPPAPAPVPVSYVPPSLFASSERSQTPSPHDEDPEHEYNDISVSGVPPPRKKRVQVRVACTHCQKACKKCSNTRPCDRCVKYGFKDCVDSTRKPRKTGVKRGPYKRRTSSIYHEHASGTVQMPVPVPVSIQAPPQSLLMPTHNLNLTQAFAAAFERGPRWVNGQRQRQPEPLPPLPPPPPQDQPPTFMGGRRPSLPPPIIGLSGLSQDPFSRAVSPIGQKFAVGTDFFKSVDHAGAGTGTGMGFVPPPQPKQWMTIGTGTGLGTGHSTPSSTGPDPISQTQNGISVIDYAFAPPTTNPNQAFYSLPPSPRSLSTDIGPQPRPSSADPAAPYTPVQPPQTGGRRPSLQLFMGQSTTQPIFPWSTSASTPGDQSPTLFDGPMDQDEQWK